MSTYDTLKGQKERLGVLASSVGVRDLAGLAKLGYTSLYTDAPSFKLARESHPNLKGIFQTIGFAAVPVNAKGQVLVNNQGQPVATKYDTLMATFGDKIRKDSKFLDNLSRDISQNPGLEAKLIKTLQNQPNAAARGLNSYTGQAGQLTQLVDNLNKPAAPAPAAPKLAAAAPAAAKPAAPSAPAPKVEAPKPQVEPVAVAAAVTTDADAEPDATGADAVAAGVAPEIQASTNTNFTAADIAQQGGIADQVSNRLLDIYPDMQNDIETFRTKLKTDKPLQEDIAQNLNRHPDFMRQLISMGDKQGDDAQKMRDMMQRYGRDEVKGFLNDPSKLADDKYVSGLSHKMQMASGGGGIMGMISNLFNGSGLSDIMGKIGEFLQHLPDMLGGLLGKIGGGSFLSMGNKDMFGALASSGVKSGLASQLNNNPDVFRMADHNGDGKLSEDDMLVNDRGQKYYGGAESHGVSGEQRNPILVTKVEQDQFGRYHVTEAKTLDTSTGRYVSDDKPAEMPKPPVPEQVANNGIPNAQPGGMNGPSGGGAAAGGVSGPSS